MVGSAIANAQSEGNNDNVEKEIACRLVQSEIKVQEAINKLGVKVKRGSLVQALIQEENADLTEFLYLIAKVEHSEWIDEADLLTKIGFSSGKKNIWKSCIFECFSRENNILVGSAKVYVDATTKYWHDSFR